MIDPAAIADVQALLRAFSGLSTELGDLVMRRRKKCRNQLEREAEEAALFILFRGSAERLAEKVLSDENEKLFRRVIDEGAGK